MKKVLLNAVVLTLALVICPAAFSQKKADKKAGKKAPKESVKEVSTLSYKFVADKNVKFLTTSKIIQSMDINGQSMEVNVNEFIASSFKSKGNKDGNILLEVRIDSMAQSMDSPQGSAGGKVADAAGKVFNMGLSSSGKEDLTEAKQVVINTEGFGPTDASQQFRDFFPDMPAGTLNPGYTWTSLDSLDNRTASGGEKATVKSENKFEGFEIVNGVNCAKISSALSGKRIQNFQTQGMDLVINGDYTGTSVLYFFVDEGYPLRQTVTTKLTGIIDITSQGMSFPIIIDNTTVKEVIK